LTASSFTLGHSFCDRFVDRLVEIDARFACAKRIGARDINEPSSFAAWRSALGTVIWPLLVTVASPKSRSTATFFKATAISDGMYPYQQKVRMSDR
jgi:hypothetical protein